MNTEFFIGLNNRRMKNMFALYTGLSVLSLIVFFIFGSMLKDFELTFRISGFVFALFFGIVAGTYLKRYRDKAAGIYFSNKGFIDQASSISCGEIAWKDVTGIKRVQGKSLLLVDTKMSERIIKGAKNKAVARLLERNADIYGTPVVINGAELNAEMDDIRLTFRRFYERQKGKKINEN